MPQFNPGEVKTAKVAMRNPTGKAFDYRGVLYMGIYLAPMSEVSFRLEAGQEKTVSFTVTMPAIEGVYPVYLGVFSDDENVPPLYRAEDVTILAPAISDPNIDKLYINYWTQGAEPHDFLVNSKQTVTLSFRTYVSETYKLEVVLVKDGEVKASAYFQGYFQDTNAFYSAVNIDNIVLPSEPGEYGVQIRTYRGGQLTGIYDEGKITVYPITEPSSLAFQNLVFSLPQYPGLVWHYLDIACDIVNTGNKTITREVALWHHYQDYTAKYGHYWRVINRDSHEPGGINAGRVAFTLAPGATFHYRFAGQTVGRGESCVELRDNTGGKSDYRCLVW